VKKSEEVILETLRKTTLSYLSDFDYSAIVSEVEQRGITNLSGTVGKLVQDAVRKHGSHNQASHGGKGGGAKGGGGGGGGTPSDAKNDESMRDDKVVDALATEVDELKIEIDEYYDALDDADVEIDEDVVGRVSDSLDAATQNMDRAMEVKDIDKHEAFMDTAEGHLADAAMAITYGSADMQSNFKRTIEQLRDKAGDYLGDLDDSD
jgi:hypothetical protein